MAKQLEIKRIDLLVHPFFYVRKHYTEKEAGELLKLWKSHVDEVAKDPSRLLLIVRSSIQSIPQKKMGRELVKYAKQTLGNRAGLFENPKGKSPFHDNLGKPFKRFEDYLAAKDFRVNFRTVKTRGLGEYNHVCVTEYLTKLNVHVGLENAIPYRNRQSTILPRKSVGSYDYLLAVKHLLRSKELTKTQKGRRLLKKAGEHYAKRRLKKANMLAKQHWGEKNYFKPRTHLKKVKCRV